MEQQQKITEISIPVPWGVISGKTWGDDLGIPVLCVHGIIDNCDSFSRLIPLLPESCYYVCIDLPGHGRSSHFQQGQVLNNMMYVLAIKRVVNHFGWKKVNYVGHSLGGNVGLYFTCVYPEHVEKIISIDSFIIPPKSTETGKFFKQRFTELLEMEDKLRNSNLPSYTMEEVFQRILNSRFSSITGKDIKNFVERSVTESGSGFRFTYDQRLKLGVHPALTATQVADLLSSVQCPVLVIVAALLKPRIKDFHNDNDGVWSSIVNKQNIRFIEFNKHHDFHITEPELLAPVISQFLLSENCNL